MTLKQEIRKVHQNLIQNQNAMVFEKGVHNLKKYVENEEKECKKIDEQ